MATEATSCCNFHWIYHYYLRIEKWAILIVFR
jgi:hypothetical protein